MTNVALIVLVLLVLSRMRSVIISAANLKHFYIIISVERYFEETTEHFMLKTPTGFNIV